jgi:uncharacterized small protein (DUF1192 family)
VEETITIRRSEYEQLLSVIAELREKNRQLQEEIELLKNGRNSKPSSTFHRTTTARKGLYEMSKSKQKCPVSSVTRRKRVLTALQGFALLLEDSSQRIDRT